MTDFEERFLARGKRYDNGEWAFGYVFRASDEDFLINSPFEDPEYYSCIVNPQTLGRYTGLKDKDGKRIFERDILQGFTYPFFSDGEHNYFAEVVWLEKSAAFGLVTHKNPKASIQGISDGNTEYVGNFEPSKWQVIGNVYDNPELLKE